MPTLQESVKTVGARRYAPFVAGLKPSVVVWCGGNADLEWGAEPREAFEQFRAALRLLRAAAPTLPVVVVAALLTPRHADVGPGVVRKIRALNALIADYARTVDRVDVVDPNALPFARDPFSYEADRCTPTAAGCRSLGEAVYPAVARAYATSPKTPEPAASDGDVVLDVISNNVAAHVPAEDVVSVAPPPPPPEPPAREPEPEPPAKSPSARDAPARASTRGSTPHAFVRQSVLASAPGDAPAAPVVLAAGLEPEPAPGPRGKPTSRLRDALRLASDARGISTSRPRRRFASPEYPRGRGVAATRLRGIST